MQKNNGRNIDNESEQSDGQQHINIDLEQKEIQPMIVDFRFKMANCLICGHCIDREKILKNTMMIHVDHSLKEYGNNFMEILVNSLRPIFDVKPRQRDILIISGVSGWT